MLPQPLLASPQCLTQQGSRYVSLADYCAMGHSEVSMKEGDAVELLKIGCAGWWFVKVLGDSTGSNLAEGWAPAAYLETSNKRPMRRNHEC